MKKFKSFQFVGKTFVFFIFFTTITTIGYAQKVYTTPVSYIDGRPHATLRLKITDEGMVLPYGTGPDSCDTYGAREACVVKEKDTYYLHYDGAGKDGWLSCLATSKDLRSWKKYGSILHLGSADKSDSKSASSPWVYKEGNTWHMFYLGTPNCSPAPDRIPMTPYLTLKAKASNPAGPWTKQYNVVPFNTKPNSYYSETASPGDVVNNGHEYMMFFSASAVKEGIFKRTLSIARTKNLDGAWTLDPEPIIPLEEQVENSSLYYEKNNKTWFLFTNHIGILGNIGEFTDAIWVYWSKDLNMWDTKNKAIVIDKANSKSVKGAIGMPTVIQVGHRLAMLYDGAPGENYTHMSRNIGLAWIDLPLVPPNKITVASH